MNSLFERMLQAISSSKHRIILTIIVAASLLIAIVIFINTIWKRHQPTSLPQNIPIRSNGPENSPQPTPIQRQPLDSAIPQNQVQPLTSTPLSIQILPKTSLPSYPQEWRFSTCIPNEETYRDPIDILLNEIDETHFDEVAAEWPKLDWYQRLGQTIKSDFERFLSNIYLQDIPRQEEVFRNATDSKNTFTLFKKAVVYLYQNLQSNPELGEHIVLQLNNVVDECPLSYLSSLNTALNSVTGKLNLSGGIEENFMKGIHHLYAQKRRDIVASMATEFGRAETHTPNTILTLIGRERNIPGYQTVIGDRQADIPNSQRPELLAEFDRQNAPHQLIAWFYRKVNGLVDTNSAGISIYHLHGEITNYLAQHFNVDISTIRDVFYDENMNIRIEAVIASLELAGVIERTSRSSAISFLENELRS